MNDRIITLEDYFHSNLNDQFCFKGNVPVAEGVNLYLFSRFYFSRYKKFNENHFPIKPCYKDEVKDKPEIVNVLIKQHLRDLIVYNF